MTKADKVFVRILGYQIGMKVRFEGVRDGRKVWFTGFLSFVPEDRKGMFLITRDKRPYLLFPKFEHQFEMIKAEVSRWERIRHK